MIKRNYLAIVNDNFDPENTEFKNSLVDKDMRLEDHFPELGIIKLIAFTNGNTKIDASDLPFVEHLEIEGEVRIPPGEM